MLVRYLTPLPVARRKAALAPAGEPGMAGNTMTLLDNPYLGSAALHFYLALAGSIRHRVQVAVDGHRTVLGHPAFE